MASSLEHDTAADAAHAGTLTQGLVALIRAKPIETADLEAMALLTLDGLANMLAGRNTEAGRILLKWADGRQGDAGRRALLRGALMHIPLNLHVARHIALQRNRVAERRQRADRGLVIHAA